MLADAMPRRIITAVRNKPKVMHKKDGSLSANGEKWVALCKEQKQPETTVSLTVKTGEERANPNSTDQVKDWLFSLGWKPRTFKYLTDKKTGDTRKLEQVRKDADLCSSVKSLADIEPAISLLEGLSVLSHRIGVIKSMVNTQVDGYVQGNIAGLTNTLRFKHAKPLVNLPSVDKPYGKEIRGCLTCPEGYTLCGADMTSLEDTTKRHYMKPLDPDYVEEMSKEGFDPHLDLAKHAGVITQEDIDKHNSGEVSLTPLRKNYKVVNYSATYGVGASTLSRNTGMSSKDAKKLLEAFWSRNWSVYKVASTARTRDLFGSTWLYNPVSEFWYSLRSDKDRFSTLNQGTGVFCFDSWVSLCRRYGIKTIGQFHDEIIALVQEGEEEQTKATMEQAIENLNQKLELNVPLGVDAQFGKSYADIH
jgi:DNA polymerase I-like protein with 3'-5' exonuclease and polymerase domains